MIRTAWPHDLPALRALFARANETPYDLVRVAEEKCFGLGYSGSPVVRVWGNFEGAIVTCGRYVRLIAVAPEVRRRGIATALLADAESRGASVIAAEPGNYFTPGVPMDNEDARAFFHHRGYIETRWTYNLDVSLESIDDPAAAGVRRPSHRESDRMLGFIEREFGAIWRFEAAKAFESEVPQAVIAEERGEIRGFAVHDVNNRGLGFFGPTGVEKSMRGRGLGCALLLASLSDMRRMGFARAVIPWTDALEFYRKCSGALPAARFATFAKEL